MYVGVEVFIGSMLVNYLVNLDVVGLLEGKVFKLLVYFWGGVMVGWFIGVLVM